MKIYAVTFPITEFVKARQTLRTEKIIDKKKKYTLEGRKVLFPLKTYPSSHQLELIRKRKGEILEIKDEKFPKKGGTTVSLKKLGECSSLPLPKSVTQTGNILLLNQLPEGGLQHKERIGKILKKNFNARAVFLKKKEIKGKERVPKWSKLAGRGDPIALHKELGFYYFVDYSKVFFNPRMGGERKRVITKTNRNEIVLDMFAGVGPFSIPIARGGSQVYAIDINPVAIKLLKINKKLNNIEDSLVSICGNAKEKAKDLKDNVDRIIMNYPSNSLDFLEVALDALKKRGTLHLYCFTYGEGEKIALKEAEEKINVLFTEFKDYTIVRNQIKHTFNVAPAKHLIVSDLTVESNRDF